MVVALVFRRFIATASEPLKEVVASGISSERHPIFQAEQKKKHTKIGKGLQPDSGKKGNKEMTVVRLSKYSIRSNGSALERIEPPPFNGKVPELSHNLDRVLFSPGVHFLQDPRTRMFNFSPYLRNIMPIDEFNFDKITKYVTASKDEILLSMCKQKNKKYYSSTSSMTSTLSQLHFFLSGMKPLNFADLSRHFEENSKDFSYSSKLPACVTVKLRGRNEAKGKIFAIDSDKSFDKETILSLLGHSMEKLLVTDEVKFETFRIKKDAKAEAKAAAEDSRKDNAESYNYSTYGKFLMRSQLDCYDHRLPGNGTFDLKTRAVCAVRHDIDEVEQNLTNYQICKLKGEFESFEREDYELYRSAFLKYSLQARIGQMDGIFVAYHNVSQLFGFQYFPLPQIDRIIHGNGLENLPSLSNLSELKVIQDREDMPTFIAEKEFLFSLDIWSNILDRISQKYNNLDSFRLIIKAEMQYETPVLNILMVPLTADELTELESMKITRAEVQSESIEKIANNQRSKIMNFVGKTINKVQGYQIFAKHFIDGKFAPIPRPRSTNIKWEIDIRTNLMTPQYAQKKYESYISDIASLNSINKSENSFIQTLRSYGNVGKDRLNSWKKEEATPKVWDPKNFNEFSKGEFSVEPEISDSCNVSIIETERECI